MAESHTADLQPAKQVRLPRPGGPGRLLRKEALIRYLGHFVRQLGVRLQVDGARETGRDRFTVDPGAAAGPDVEPGPGTDPGDDADCLCALGGVLEAKRTLLCGRAQCCGDPVPNGGDPPVETASLITTTQECDTYDNTTGTVVTGTCTFVTETDLDVGGSGTAAGDCADGVPPCGEDDTTTSGCTGFPVCGGTVPPPPGFKCRVVTSTTIVRGKICTYADLPTAALAAAVEQVDADFTDDAITDMLGASSSVDGGDAQETSWEFRRRGQRKPVHLILEITEVDLASVVTTYEEIITLPASLSTGTYVLPAPAGGGSATITDVTVIWGQLPP